jgi:hypothetical protein
MALKSVVRAVVSDTDDLPKPLARLTAKTGGVLRVLLSSKAIRDYPMEDGDTIVSPLGTSFRRVLRSGTTVGGVCLAAADLDQIPSSVPPPVPTSAFEDWGVFPPNFGEFFVWQEW